MSLNVLKAKALLLKHEGLRLKPYRCTSGKLTIGVGRNLEDTGITEDEAYHMLAHDIVRVYQELDDALVWFTALDSVRQLALVDMCFNLGLQGLLQFKRMLSAIEACDWVTAGYSVLDSKYARQVKGRAVTIAEMITTGVMPHGI